MNKMWTCFAISLSDNVLQKKRYILITELTIVCSRNIASAFDNYIS